MGGFKIGPWGPVANAWFQGKGIAQQEKTASDAAAVNQWQTEQSVFGDRVRYDEDVRRANAEATRQAALDAENIRQFDEQNTRLREQNELTNQTRADIAYDKNTVNNRKWMASEFTRIFNAAPEHYRMTPQQQYDYTWQTMASSPYGTMFAQIVPYGLNPMAEYSEMTSVQPYDEMQPTSAFKADTQRMGTESDIRVDNARIPVYDAQADVYAERARLLGPEFELKYWKIHEIDARTAQAYIDNAYQNINESQYGMQMDSAQFQLDQQKQQVANANILIDNITNMLRLDPKNIAGAKSQIPQIVTQLGGIYSYWGEDGDAIAAKFLTSIDPYIQKYGGGPVGSIFENMMSAYEIALNSSNTALQQSILLDLADLNAKLGEMIANMPTIQAPRVPNNKSQAPGRIPGPGEAGYPDFRSMIGPPQ